MLKLRVVGGDAFEIGDPYPTSVVDAGRLVDFCAILSSEIIEELRGRPLTKK